jgi:hypothetical protein
MEMTSWLLAVDCHAGKLAVEVGSALGMVSMYLAERGMRVLALDPVPLFP